MTMTTVRAPSLGLSRFLDAQRRAPYSSIYREIQAGRKRSHWMWFVFPQLRALAKSETALKYGIADLAEANAYLNDETLRARLGECTLGILAHRRLMFDATDRRKLQASMTLFREATNDPTLPTAVLEKFFGGDPHQKTLDILNGTIPNEPIYATRRVDVSRHWEKQIASARAAVAAVGQRAPKHGYAETMSREEIVSFMRGFGLSEAAVRRVVTAWMDDQDHAREAAWESARDSFEYND